MKKVSVLYHRNFIKLTIFRSFEVSWPAENAALVEIACFYTHRVIRVGRQVDHVIQKSLVGVESCPSNCKKRHHFRPN